MLHAALDTEMGQPISTFETAERSGEDGFILQDFDPRFSNSEHSWRSRGTDAQREAMNAEEEDRTEEPRRVVREDYHRSSASAQVEGRTSTGQVPQRRARRRTLSREVEAVITSRDVSSRTRMRVETIASDTVQGTYDREGTRTPPAHRQETQPMQVSRRDPRNRSTSPHSNPIDRYEYSHRTWPPESQEVMMAHSPEAISHGVVHFRDRPVDAAMQDENAIPGGTDSLHRNQEGQTTLPGRRVRESAPRIRRQSTQEDNTNIDGGALVRTPRRRTNPPSWYVPESHAETYGEGVWHLHTVSSHLASLDAMTSNLPQIPASRVSRPRRVELSGLPVARRYQLPQLLAEANLGFADGGEIQWPSAADRMRLTETYGEISAGGSRENSSQSNAQDILRSQRARQRAVQGEASLHPTGVQQTHNSSAYTSDRGNLEEAYKRAYRLLDQSCSAGLNRLEMQANLQGAIDRMNLEEDKKRLGLW